MTNKEKDVRKVVILALIVCVFFFSVAYAVLAKNLNISASSNINASWNIKITDIKSKDVLGTATNSFEPKVLSDTAATFGTNLIAPGDAITYEITIENKGTINAILKDIIVSESSTINNSNIKYNITGVTTDITTLKTGNINVAELKVYYDDINNVNDFKTETKDLGITFIYQQN